MFRHLMRRIKDSLLHGRSSRYGPHYRRYSSSAKRHYGYGQQPPYRRYTSSAGKHYGHGGHNRYGSPYYKKKRSSFFSS